MKSVIRERLLACHEDGDVIDLRRLLELENDLRGTHGGEIALG